MWNHIYFNDIPLSQETGLPLYDTLELFSINHLLFQASGPNGLFHHVVSINADQYTATDNQSIPTGEYKSTHIIYLMQI
jgi:hypothetical protein